MPTSRILFCNVLIQYCIFDLQKFKRLRRIEDEESEGEEAEDEGKDRDTIAMEIFSDDVSCLN